MAAQGKSKAKDARPARKRYWMKRTLESRKVKNLMKFCGMTRQTAYNLWHKVRKTRVPDGYIDRYV
jgi:hypothetical protein